MVARRVHRQPPTDERLRGAVIGGKNSAGWLRLQGFAAAQDRPDAGQQEAEAERLGDVIVGAELEARLLVLLVILAGQENHRERRALPQPPQQFHPVHLGHLDIEHRKIGRVLEQCLQRRFAIGIEAGDEPFGLERDRDRGEDVAVIVDQRDDLSAGCGFPGLLCWF